MPMPSQLEAGAAHGESSTRSISNFRSNRYIKEKANEKDRNGSTGALPAFDSDFNVLSSQDAVSGRKGVAGLQKS
jgi:hypothetical protein